MQTPALLRRSANRLAVAGSLCCLVIAKTLHADAATPPRFEDYPVASTYEGPKVPVKLRQGEGAWPFRTAIREAYGTTPVNFAGRFVAVEWPCGAPCQSWAIVDARSGAVYPVPFPTAGGAEFRATSALFVADPRQCVGNECEEPAAFREQSGGALTSYYFWSGDTLQEIPRQVANPSPDQQARAFLELTEAARAGDLRKVEWMLRRGVVPEHPPIGESEAGYFSEQRDPIQGAAEHGFDRVVAVLLANGADPNWQCCSGETALVLAAANNHLETVQVLLAGGADPLLMGDGGPALVTALAHGNLCVAGSLTLPTLRAAGPGALPLLVLLGAGVALPVYRRLTRLRRQRRTSARG